MKSKYLMIGASVCAALFLFSGVMLYRQYADEKQSAEAFDNIAALVQDDVSRPRRWLRWGLPARSRTYRIKQE